GSAIVRLIGAHQQDEEALLKALGEFTQAMKAAC
ncbi:MAG: tryptophan synthase subunit alpha, partial [Shewanella sp.]